MVITLMLFIYIRTNNCVPQKELILTSIDDTKVYTCISREPYFHKYGSLDPNFEIVDNPLFGTSKYIFDISSGPNEKNLKRLNKLSIDSNGDVKNQVLNYCRSNEFSSKLCHDLKEVIIEKVQRHRAINIFDDDLCSMKSCKNDHSESGNKSCRLNGLKIAIVHLATVNAHWSASHAQAINLFYARRHGYDFISHSCPNSLDEHVWDRNDQVRANWAKPSIVLDYLKKYHFIVLLDSDAHINDPSITIEDMINLHMRGNSSVVVPNNCYAAEPGNIDSWECWNNGLNIGVILVKSTYASFRIMQEWAEAVHNDCKQYAAPQWEGIWQANDQRCLDELYRNRSYFSNHIQVLDHSDTFRFSGGAKNAWIAHYFTSTSNLGHIGFNIQKNAALVMMQKTFNHLEPREHSGWMKYPKPVFGGAGGGMGKSFGICVLYRAFKKEQLGEEDHRFGMYFSWEMRNSIGLSFSESGDSWSAPISVFSGRSDNNWDAFVSQPSVLYRDSLYHLWFSGQDETRTVSAIGYATSSNGIDWERLATPVLSPLLPWESRNIICSHVLYDEERSLYRMWYSAGQVLAIGHAFSCDGITWNRTHDVPIFTPSGAPDWEKDHVSCPAIVYNGEYHYMFYVGYADILHTAAIGVARSRDGINNWERHPGNPIIKPTKDEWDSAAVSKPYPIWDGAQWLVWYNGRRGDVEQIGLATLEDHDLFAMAQ